MSLVLSFFLFSFSLFAKASTTSPLSFPSQGIKSLSVSVPKGKIVLVGTKGQKDVSVQILEQKGSDKEKCQKNVGLENSRLVVKISSDGLFDKANCRYEVTVTTPMGSAFDIEASTGSGDISVKDVPGSLNIMTASGAVSVEGDVLKNITAKTATGAVSLRYKTCSGRADLDLMTATGKTSVELPANCKIRVDYKSATGKLFNAIGESEDYQVLINSKSASGDLSILKK